MQVIPFFKKILLLFLSKSLSNKIQNNQTKARGRVFSSFTDERSQTFCSFDYRWKILRCGRNVLFLVWVSFFTWFFSCNSAGMDEYTKRVRFSRGGCVGEPNLYFHLLHSLCFNCSFNKVRELLCLKEWAKINQAG